MSLSHWQRRRWENSPLTYTDVKYIWCSYQNPNACPLFCLFWNNLFSCTRFWSRSRFTFTPKCDLLVNNISEGFNSVLVPARAKPIITMLEDIRTYIMQRWAKNRLKIASFQGSVCPKILSRLQKEANQTRYWIPRLDDNIDTLF